MIAVAFSLPQTRTPRAHCTPMSQLAKAFESVVVGLLVTEMFYLTTGWLCPSPGGSRVRIVLPRFLLGEIFDFKAQGLI